MHRQAGGKTARQPLVWLPDGRKWLDMQNDALEVRKAALALMDAADLLEGGQGAEARARVREVIDNLNTVFSRPLPVSLSGVN